ncbi:MAG: M1 family aminopeptidase [Acidobacteriota bacterium]|nr:M1 family aminopeptidase [Blastocatellia bacterium]MDW8240147.1 M1 family aminopeptidase [Acidobacteriota bacterium]
MRQVAVVLLVMLWPWMQARAEARQLLGSAGARPTYRIELDLDQGSLTYWGQETVRYVHTDGVASDVVWFLLAPNARTASSKDASPLLFVRRVKVDDEEVQFQVHDSTRVEVTLPKLLAKGDEIRLELEFVGKVPPLDPMLNTLPAHFTEQIAQVINSRERRTYVDPPFFVSEQFTVLARFHPILAPRRNGQWYTQVTRTVDDEFCGEAADYELLIRAPAGVMVHASGRAAAVRSEAGKRAWLWRGEGVRDVLVIAGLELDMVSEQVGPVEVQSFFLPDDEAVARQVLQYAAKAVAAYQSLFGPYPYQQLRLVATPLPAGRMSASASSLIALARAYYVDFQSPRGLALPGMIREHAELIQQGLEFHVAYAVARQWWGAVVASDCRSAHFLDNTLATHAALRYYERNYGPEERDAQVEAQLKAAYRVYRMFGGQDQSANQPVSRFKNNFQYTSIVHVKGALLLEALRQVVGEPQLTSALQQYYLNHLFGIADESALLRLLRRSAGQRSGQVAQLYERWIAWRRGDQDIGKPEYRIVVSAGIGPSDEGRPSAFEWLGRTIARQMTRVGRYAVRPF